MADWDADSPELQENLTRLMRRIKRDAQRREPPSARDARLWHAELMQNLRSRTKNSSAHSAEKSGWKTSKSALPVGTLSRPPTW
jgi:MoxR-like ATPase